MTLNKSTTSQDPFANTTDLVCDSCGKNVFIPALCFKQKSALLSSSGKKELTPIQVFACIACHNVNESFRVK